MNMRHEAILWSRLITAATALGLAVVWAAIALAFSRPNLAPLYFATAPYRQDDYSAEGENVARLNPLDPALEQEVMIEDQARGNPLFNVNGPKPTSISIPLLLINTSVPLPINTAIPLPTSTSVQTPIGTPIPLPTSISIPPPASTSISPTQPPKPPKPTKPPKPPKPTKPPKPDEPPKPDKPPKSE